MLEQYFPILLFIGIAVAIGLVLVSIGYILGCKHPNKEKRSAYECGFEPFETARLPFDVRFYLVAILFIIFDLETAFMFPWAVVVKKISWLGISTMGIFLSLLVIGFLYEWKKGALEWE